MYIAEKSALNKSLQKEGVGMIYKELGNTGLKVSVIGFGGIPVQRIDANGAKEVLKKAEETGMNFIDTARGYTISENYIGEALEGRRDKWIIATKSMARDKAAMEKDVETSLRNLKTDYIDLYQFHNVRTKEDYEKVLSDDGAYAALLQAKKDGKIGHIGITSHSLDILRIAVESGKFETIMYPYNFVETQGFDLFKRAHALNIGVIAMKPLAGGNLDNGTMALKFIVENENVTTAIPGMATLNEVEENAKVGNEFVPLTYEEREKALNIAKELGTEFCRRCSYCAPCSAGIDIPSIILLKNYKEKYDLKDWAESRYFATDKRAKDCIQCGKCEKRCPYDLPIMKIMKNIRKCFNE